MSLIKFCVFDKCKAVAVGTGIRPVKYCRRHYREVHDAEFEVWNVVIDHRALGVDPEQFGIACVRTGESVPQGPVWLDPVETNIAALVHAGFIEAAPAAAKATAEA